MATLATKCTSNTAMPLTKKKTNKTLSKENPHKKIYQLLEKLHYERDRPSALGGVEKLYQAAHHYGLKRSQVIHWLQQQPGYTLHKPARKKFPRNKVFVNGLDEQWQCDLCDLTSLSQWNRGHKYILTCIDVLSKQDLYRLPPLQKYLNKDGNLKCYNPMQALSSKIKRFEHFSRSMVSVILSLTTRQKPKS